MYSILVLAEIYVAVFWRQSLKTDTYFLDLLLKKGWRALHVAYEHMQEPIRYPYESKSSQRRNWISVKIATLSCEAEVGTILVLLDVGLRKPWVGTRISTLILPPCCGPSTLSWAHGIMVLRFCLVMNWLKCVLWGVCLSLCTSSVPGQPWMRTKCCGVVDRNYICWRIYCRRGFRATLRGFRRGWMRIFWRKLEKHCVLWIQLRPNKGSSNVGFLQSLCI